MHRLIRHLIEALFGGRGTRDEALRGGGRPALPKHEMFFYRDFLLPPLL